jgi:hypothetical protein
MPGCFRLHMCLQFGRRGNCQRDPLHQDTVTVQPRGRSLLFLRIDCTSCDLPRSLLGAGEFAK